MDAREYTPPPVTCPRCGKPATWRPPARPGKNGGWAADFECENGHHLEVFSKPKRQPEHPA